MALSPLRSKTLHHGRSLSLPYASNPAISQFDENLSRVRSSEAACSSLSSMNSRVNGLTILYTSIDDLLLLSHNQHMITEKCIDRLLDDYIRLLDACNGVKDVVSLAKKYLRELLSAVRRKDVNGIHVYLTSRRRLKKMIRRSLKSLKCSRSKTTLEKDAEKSTLDNLLKDAESVASSVLESLLSYVMGQERKSGWSLVSKLIHSKKASNHEGEDMLLNEFNKVDSILQLSQENEELVNHLKDMDSSIQAVEEEVESFFRQLIKTRVSLLNILNH